jgi:hypothetical protein
MVEDTGGPYLRAALICERVLQEQDSVVSAIRVIDRLTFPADETGVPLNPQFPITFLIMFTAAAARGNFTVGLDLEKPSGEQLSVLQAPVFFEGGERSVNMILSTQFEPDQQGLYWFGVSFERERVTRIPLRAIFQQPPTADRGG